MPESDLAVPLPPDSCDEYVVVLHDGGRVTVSATTYDVEGEDYVFRDEAGVEVARYALTEVDTVTMT